MATRARRINTSQTDGDISMDENVTTENLESEETVVTEHLESEKTVNEQQDISPVEISPIPFEMPEVIEETIPIIQTTEEIAKNVVSEIVPNVESNEFFVNIETHVTKLVADAIIPKQNVNSSCFDLSANFTDVPVVLIVTRDNVRINRPVSVLDNNRQFRGIVLEGHERALIPTNLKFNFPENCVLKIYGRPGLSFNSGLTLSSGVDIINSSYKDALYISIHNTSNIRYTIKSGDKIAQAEIAPFFITNFKLIT